MPSMTSAWLSGTSSKISAKKHMANYQWLDVNGPGGTSSTHGLEQAMDRPERFPHPLLHICQQDDIDILVGVVTNHRAHAGVDALFLCEQDFPGPINSEHHPISVHLIPALLRVVEYLGSEKCCRRLGREQGACFHLAEKPVQVACGNVCTAIGRPDRRVG